MPVRGETHRGLIASRRRHGPPEGRKALINYRMRRKIFRGYFRRPLPVITDRCSMFQLTCNCAAVGGAHVLRGCFVPTICDIRLSID